MSDLNWKVPRIRRKNLLIVEGNHEKNKLFWLILKSFPEIDINMNDIWIYGTNIYMLYEDIVREYGEEWYDDDIDLPFVISKKQNYDSIQYKNDFTNIILIFDYEHHDPKFDEEKILEMQGYFRDSTDMGRLYINYPMIESYQHLTDLPDSQYENRKISVTLQPGKQYKKMIRNTIVNKSVDFLHKVRDILERHYNVSDTAICDKCVEEVLEISDASNLRRSIAGKLEGIMAQSDLNTAKYQFEDIILKMGYIQKGYSYWKYMRNMFQQIVIHNICKANKIQNGKYQISSNEYRSYFDKLDLEEILYRQNEISRDSQNGYIWVLSTCVFIVAEYNFSLIQGNIENSTS